MPNNTQYARTTTIKNSMEQFLLNQNYPTFNKIIQVFEKIDLQKICNDFIKNIFNEMTKDENWKIMSNDRQKSECLKEFEGKISTALYDLVNELIDANVNKDVWNEHFHLITDIDYISKITCTLPNFIKWITNNSVYDFKIRFYYCIKSLTNKDNKKIKTIVENNYTVRKNTNWKGNNVSELIPKLSVKQRTDSGYDSNSEKLSETCNKLGANATSYDIIKVKRGLIL